MKSKIIIIILNLFILLGFINWSAYKKECLLADGQLVLLKLAPVDPRSLMQGDYMRLSYAIAQNDESKMKLAKRGFIVVKLDKNNVAKRVRVQSAKTPLSTGEYLINYTLDKYGWQLNIGAESYFFEEGTGKKFEDAQYGALRIDNKGNSLLAGLYNKDLKFIKP